MSCKKHSKKEGVNLKYIRQFGIILIISFTGEILSELLPLPVPASIYGIILMLICLGSGIIKVSDIRETSDFLIEIMPLLFVPAAVGLLDSWHILKPVWIQYITITVVTTFLVMIAAGWVTQAVIRHSAKKEGGGNA